MLVLKNHPLIGISHIQNELTWTLHHDDRQETEVFRFRPRLASNDVIPLYQAVLGGLGIGLIPEFMFQMEQKDCKLVNVLPQ